MGDVVRLPGERARRRRRVVLRSPFGRPVRVRLDVVSEELAIDGSKGPAWFVDRLRVYGEQRRQVLVDYQRGTIRSGPRAGDPYAPSTIAHLYSDLNTLERDFAEYEEALRRLQPGDDRIERVIRTMRRAASLDPEPAA